MRHIIIRHIASESQGAVMTIVALAMVALVGSVGLAIDVGRAQMVHAKLQSAVDAAGLAAGAAVNSTDVNALATKYIQLNFNTSAMGATLGPVTSTISTNSQVVTLNVTATLPTTFMKIFGHTTVPIQAITEVTRSNKGIELAMVLDTTGSMAGTKLTSLKNAAHDLVGILFGSNATSANIWVGVVPFSQSVNIGTGRSSWLDGTSFNWGTTSWGGCVEARSATGRDITDDPPTVEKFRAYYWADHNTYNNWIQSGSYVINSNQGPNLYCPAAITPLSNVKATIDAGIDTLVADGNTHINYGAVWGWRLLSPRWRGQWGGAMNTNNLPLDYNTPLMQKAIIIMTDGTNTMSNSVDGAYGYLSNGVLGTTNSGTAVTRLNTKLASVCTALKAQNILVYTILFQETNSTIVNLMRNCATTPDYYFNSPSEAELETAFRAIGDSLANLRISR